jgi:predicted PurR-regulated permease PerM
MNSLRIIATILVVMALYIGKSIFIPFFIALFLAILFDPTIKQLCKLNISRKIAALMVISVFLLTSASLGWFLYVYARNLTREIPIYSVKIQHYSNELTNKIEQLENSTRFIPSSATEQGNLVPKVQMVETPNTKWEHNILNWMGSVMEFLNILLFVPILLLYFLLDKENLLESFYAIAGAYFYLPKLNSDLPKMIRTFIRGNLITGLLLAIIQSAILWLLGYSDYMALGLITGVLNLFPLVGAPLAMIPISIEGMMQFSSYYPTAMAIAAIFILHLVANNILIPILLGGRLNVNSGAMIIGFLFWGGLWGGLGFLLAMPLTAFLKIFLDCNDGCAPLANLLAARPKYIMYFGKAIPPQAQK